MSSNLARECPGLPAEWINGWLAAVGTTVLDPDMRLSWTSGPSPIAVLHHPDKEVVTAVADAWPDQQRLKDMPLEVDRGGDRSLTRNPDVEVFRKRVMTARGHQDAWTLTSTLTDLALDPKGKTTHGLFDPPAPKGLVLYERLVDVHSRAFGNDHKKDIPISASFDGNPTLAACNGLGFDISRLPNRAEMKRDRLLVDPVVEVLAFFGLALLPVRGDGLRQRQVRARHRGHGIGGRPQNLFLWPAWSQPLDQWGIDALLDTWHQTWTPYKGDDGLEWRTRRSDWDRLGVHAGWVTKPYNRTNLKDITKGFSSEPVYPGHSRRHRQFSRSSN